uniref:Uncharacterized protein n=1 Tax=Arundo donax TaxID=35708 RepID=A0A0A8YIT8_ARUDO
MPSQMLLRCALPLPFCSSATTTTDEGDAAKAATQPPLRESGELPKADVSM